MCVYINFNKKKNKLRVVRWWIQNITSSLLLKRRFHIYLNIILRKLIIRVASRVERPLYKSALQGSPYAELECNSGSYYYL